MRIVIDIPEQIYNFVKETSFVEDEKSIFYQSGSDRQKTLFLFDALKAIENGTPLPEGHGRLIDADEAIKTLKSLGNRNYRKEKGTIQEAEKMLSFDEYTPTIIEADKEKDT